MTLRFVLLGLPFFALDFRIQLQHGRDGTVDSVETKANRSDDFVFNFREYSRE